MFHSCKDTRTEDASVLSSSSSLTIFKNDLLKLYQDMKAKMNFYQLVLQKKNNLNINKAFFVNFHISIQHGCVPPAASTCLIQLKVLAIYFLFTFNKSFKVVDFKERKKKKEFKRKKKLFWHWQSCISVNEITESCPSGCRTWSEAMNITFVSFHSPLSSLLLLLHQLSVIPSSQFFVRVPDVCNLTWWKCRVWCLCTGNGTSWCTFLLCITRVCFFGLHLSLNVHSELQTNHT